MRANAANDPKADRPHMPDYGIATTDDGLLPWSWARERIAGSRNYWVSTTRPDGRPHASAVWGVWFDDGLYFSTATNSRKMRNLALNPQCVITTERADESVIVEGNVEPAKDAGSLEVFKKAYDTKYAWDVEMEGILVLRPRVAFAFIEAADKFGSTATRWTF